MLELGEKTEREKEREAVTTRTSRAKPFERVQLDTFRIAVLPLPRRMPISLILPQPSKFETSASGSTL